MTQLTCDLLPTDQFFIAIKTILTLYTGKLHLDIANEIIHPMYD